MRAHMPRARTHTHTYTLSHMSTHTHSSRYSKSLIIIDDLFIQNNSPCTRARTHTHTYTLSHMSTLTPTHTHTARDSIIKGIPNGISISTVTVDLYSTSSLPGSVVPEIVGITIKLGFVSMCKFYMYNYIGMISVFKNVC